MAKTRLNARLRYLLVNALIERSHAPKVNVAREACIKARAAVYVDAVPPALQEQLKAIPAEFLNGHHWGRVSERGSLRVDTVDMPEGFSGWSGVRAVSPEVYEGYQQAKANMMHAQDECRAAHMKLASTIATFRTVEDLVAAWPDVEPVLRPLFKAPPEVPSTALVCVADLNALCGLPVDAEEAA
jgi:hypothetical protein